MASFGEVLAEFKGQEEPENIVGLVGDKVLQNAMIAWKSVSVRFHPASDCQEKDSVSRWKWLWGQVDFNSDDFGVVAGVRAQDVGRVIARLQGLRLIYPDGTINRLGSQYLQTIIMSQIARPMGRKKSSESSAPVSASPESAPAPASGTPKT